MINLDSNLHQLSHHVTTHDMIEDGLELGVLHQTELDPISMPGQQSPGLQGCDAHLEKNVGS